MSNTIKLIVFPAPDIAATKKIFTAYLRTEPYVESPYYVGYKVSDIEIGLDPQASVGPIVYSDVQDIQRAIQTLIAQGATLVQDVKDVGGGLLTAQLQDSTGTTIGFRQLASS